MKKQAVKGKEDPRFEAVVEAFAGKAGVSREERKGLGSGALKVKGRIFAMMSSKGKFVVKLPKARVDELVSGAQGEQFNPGGDRVMKEWFEVVKNTVICREETDLFLQGRSHAA
jgi:hypothetical protein